MNENRFVALVRHWSVAILVVTVAFLLALFLVVRLSSTLTTRAVVPGGLPGDGQVTLVSSVEDEGAIFDPTVASGELHSQVLEPGQTIQACLTLDTDTRGVNQGVTLDVTGEAIATNALAQLLQVTIERGTGTRATGDQTGGCRGFQAQELVASDTLAGLVSRDPENVWRPPSGEADARFRFTARLPGTVDDDLEGASAAGVTMTFATVAKTGAPAWIDQSGLLLSSLALNRSTPLGGLVVLALFFSSLQALISGDRQREAEVVPDDRAFEPPSLA